MENLLSRISRSYPRPWPWLLVTGPRSGSLGATTGVLLWSDDRVLIVSRDFDFRLSFLPRLLVLRELDVEATRLDRSVMVRMASRRDLLESDMRDS